MKYSIWALRCQRSIEDVTYTSNSVIHHFLISFSYTINLVYSTICIRKHGNRSLPVFYLSMAFHIYKDILLALIIVVIGKHKFEPSLVPDVVPMYTSMYKTRISQIEKIGPINVFFSIYKSNSQIYSPYFKFSFLFRNCNILQ